MKKLLVLTTAAFVFAGSIFAENFFDHRIVELKVDVPAQVSNNLISVGDLLEGGELVIDLKKIADDMPKSGFEIGANAKPEVSLNVNTKKFGISLTGGVDVSGSIGIGKGLFDFLGYGNELYQEIEVDTKARVDVFAYAKLPVRVSGKKISLQFAPSVFIPVVHVNADGSKLVIANDEDGNFLVDMNENLNIYSILPASLLMDENGFVFDTAILSQMLTDALKNRYLGFDLEGAVGYKYSKALNFTVNYRIPIIPAQMSFVTPYSMKLDTKVNLMDLTSGVTPNFAPETELGQTSVCDYTMNRPLKLNLFAKFDPFANGCFVLNGGIGFGILHPFSGVKGEADFYPEYYAGLGLSLIGILSLDLSTAYQEQLFVHKAGLGLSIRLVQINVGVSTQSSSFVSSFRGDGLGAYATVCIGF